MNTNTTDLRALLAKATPGPWHTKTDCPGRCCWHLFRNPPFYGGEPDETGNQDHPIVMNECSEEDAAFMVAARNALPALLDEIDLVRDALDHVMRTARASSSQTRRLRWIASRAEVALAGRPYIAAEHDQPRMVTEVALQSKNSALQSKNLELRLANSRLRSTLAQVAGGATGYSDRDTELAQIAQAALDAELEARA